MLLTTVLAENAFRHSDGDVNLRVESATAAITIAVSDTSTIPALLRDTSEIPRGIYGLEILSAMCRTWGNSPIDTGNTVCEVSPS